MKNKIAKQMRIAWVLLFGFAAIICAEEMQGRKHKSGEKMSCRASELMGKTVQANNGRELGKINDVVIGENGAVTYYIIGAADQDKLLSIP